MNSVRSIAGWAAALFVALPVGLEVGSPALAGPPDTASTPEAGIPASPPAGPGGRSGPPAETPRVPSSQPSAGSAGAPGQPSAGSAGAPGQPSAANPSGGRPERLGNPVQARPGDPRPPELAALRAAFLAGDRDDLARAGARLAARRLAPALLGDDRELALAAAAAAPFAEDAVWMLGPLAEVAGWPDRPLAAAAARAAARIGGALDGDALLLADVPPDWIRGRAAAHRALAADAGRWTDVRVAALETAAHLFRALGERAAPPASPRDPTGQVLGWEPEGLAAFLADPDPELRRAAVELAPAPLTGEALRAIGARAADDDPSVAAAAVLAACEGLVFGEPAAPVVAALGARGMARARALAASSDVPDGARDAATRCLAAARGDRPGRDQDGGASRDDDRGARRPGNDQDGGARRPERDDDRGARGPRRDDDRGARPAGRDLDGSARRPGRDQDGAARRPGRDHGARRAERGARRKGDAEGRQRARDARRRARSDRHHSRARR